MNDKECQLIRGNGNPNLFFHPQLKLWVEAVGEERLESFYVDMLSGQLFKLTARMSSEHPNGVWRALEEWPERVMRNYVQAFGPVPYGS